MFNSSAPENVVDINSYLANPLPSTSNPPVDSPAAQSSTVDLVQTNKRLVSIVMGMTLMIGLVACIAYLAGRAMTIARSNGNPQMRQSSPILVDSPRVQEANVVAPVQVAASVATPVTTAPVVTPPPTPIAPPPAPVQPIATIGGEAPIPGKWYVQVGHVEATQLSTFRSGLEAKGFKSFAINGETVDTRRVLLGPVQDDNSRLAMQHKLKSAGYESFQRRF